MRAPYIPDLIVRHTKAPQSRALRRAGKAPSPLFQLNTIRLTKKPQGYKTPVKLKGKRVLVVDDLLATGGTVEACCRLLENTGAQVVGCAFLICLDFLNGKQRIAPHESFSLIHYS